MRLRTRWIEPSSRKSMPKVRRIAVSSRARPRASSSSPAFPGAARRHWPVRWLAKLHLPLVSKDVIKEALFDALGTGDLEWSQELGRAAHRVMYALAADAGSAVLESHFWRGVSEPDLAGARTAAGADLLPMPDGSRHRAVHAPRRLARPASRAPSRASIRRSHRAMDARSRLHRSTSTRR